MRILVDVNMPEQAVSLLRQVGHDVRWAAETHRRTADPGLLELANREGRTLITYDKDFGELVHRDSLPAPYGVVLFRIHNDVPDEVKETFIARSVMAWDSWPPGIWTVQIRHQLGHP